MMVNLLKALLKIVMNVGVLFLLRNLSVFLFIRPIEYFKNRNFRKKHAHFLRMNNGRNYFCYKNKEYTENYIKINIEPRLRDRVSFVNLNDMNITSQYSARELNILNCSNVYPYLLKIRDNRLIKKQMYNEFYRALFISKSNSNLIEDINSFFEP
jgi:hypothetical protein